MSDLLDMIRIKKEVVVFGCGERGKGIYKKLKRDFPGHKLSFCDSNPRLVGKLCLDTKILSLEEVAKRSKEALFIVSAAKSAREMHEQLLDMGIKDENIIPKPPAELLTDWEEERKQNRISPKTTLRFEVNITKHCNLNCKGCDHFAPLASNDCMDFAEYQRDMSRVAELFGELANEIHILGGEPLLHPQVVQFIHEARCLFPKAELYLDTNGTLLSRMDGIFWQTCREDRVVIEPTIYPVNVDYDALEKYAKGQGVAYQYLQKNKPGGHHTLWKCPLDLLGKQNPMESFINCANANRCITLEKGRLYTCSIASNMYIFNQYFGKDYIEITDEDGIDIHKAGTPREIFEYLAKPMPACRYCDIKNRSMDHPWECSKKSMDEWS